MRLALDLSEALRILSRLKGQDRLVVIDGHGAA
jgi:hypothetical protein